MMLSTLFYCIWVVLVITSVCSGGWTLFTQGLSGNYTLSIFSALLALLIDFRLLLEESALASQEEDERESGDLHVEYQTIASLQARYEAMKPIVDAVMTHRQYLREPPGNLTEAEVLHVFLKDVEPHCEHLSLKYYANRSEE